MRLALRSLSTSLNRGLALVACPMVVLALFAALLPIEGRAAAGLPPHDLTRPQISQAISAGQGPILDRSPAAAPSPAAAAAPGPAVGGGGARPLREVFGFVNAGNLADTGYGFPSWNFSMLSTVAFFGLHVDPASGNLVMNDANANVWNSAATTNLVSIAHQSGTRVVVSIVLIGSDLCGAMSRASVTIPQIVSEMRSKGVDGVNLDYEGYNGSCGTTDPSRARHLLTDMVAQLRAALGTAPYLTVDTYASSAADPYGFFDIAAMAPSVDAFFVMAYDLDNSNSSYLPQGCPSSYCLSPVAPLAGYHYNDTDTVAQYSRSFPGAANKTILGVPYYGTKGCVATAAPNQPMTPRTYSAPTYTYASSAATDTGVTNFIRHTDGLDPAGQEEWDTWNSSTYNCIREQYWDNATSLGLKYDLVNNAGLRGVGIFTLDYGGGAPELWSQLASHFSMIPAAPTSVSACAGDGIAVVSWTAPPFNASPVSSFSITASPGGATVSVSASHSWAVLGGLTNGTPYTFTVTAGNAYGMGVSSAASNPTTPAAGAVSWPGQARLLPDPVRIVDTRTGRGGVTVAGGSSFEISVLGHDGIPASGVGAVILNVTVTNTAAPGWLAVLPGGDCHNITSTLNFRANQSVPALVDAVVGPGGRVALLNGSLGAVDVVVDLQGWITDAGATTGGAGRFRAVAPARILDTRTSSTPGPLGGLSSRSIPVAGRGGLPAGGIGAVMINLTVTDTAAAPGYLTAYGPGTRPESSTVNFAAGQTAANRAILPLDSAGNITVFNGSPGSAGVVIDVTGWFTDGSAPAAGGLFTGIKPIRVVDTREGAGVPLGAVAGFTTLVIPRSSLIGLPAGPLGAVVLNLTVANPAAAGHLGVYPLGSSPEASSDLNFAPGVNAANLVYAMPSSDGAVRVYVSSLGPAHIVVDLLGWIDT